MNDGGNAEDDDNNNKDNNNNKKIIIIITIIITIIYQYKKKAYSPNISCLSISGNHHHNITIEKHITLFSLCFPST